MQTTAKLEYYGRGCKLTIGTKTVDRQLESMGGTYNTRLVGGAGWMFKLSDMERVRGYMATLRNTLSFDDKCLGTNAVNIKPYQEKKSAYESPSQNINQYQGIKQYQPPSQHKQENTKRMTSKAQLLSILKGDEDLISNDNNNFPRVEARQPQDNSLFQNLIDFDSPIEEDDELLDKIPCKQEQRDSHQPKERIVSYVVRALEIGDEVLIVDPNGQTHGIVEEIPTTGTKFKDQVIIRVGVGKFCTASIIRGMWRLDNETTTIVL